MATWEIDVVRNANLLNMGWNPKVITTLDCSMTFPEMVLIGLVLRQNVDVEGAMRQMLRTPWRTFAFSLKDKVTNTTICSEKEFSDYILAQNLEWDNENLAPAEFLRKHPTWMFKDVEYTTDFFSSLYGTDGKKDRLEVRIQGLINVHTGNEYRPTNTYRSGHEMQNIKLFKTTSDPYTNSHWDGWYTQSVSANSPNMESELTEMATTLNSLSRGIHFPYNMERLPCKSGFSKLKLNFLIIIDTFDVHRITMPFEHIVPLESEQKLCELTHMTMDLKTYDQAISLFNSCKQSFSRHGTTAQLPSVPILNSVSVVMDVLDEIARVSVSNQPDIHKSVEIELKVCRKISVLFHYPTNIERHHSEAFLLLGDTITATKEIISLAGKAGVTVDPTWATRLDGIQYEAVLKPLAKSDRVFREEDLKAKRPLNKAGTEEYHAIQKHAADHQAFMKNPEMPIYGAIILTFMLVFILVAVALVIMAAKRVNI